jgi:hypothetical protein
MYFSIKNILKSKRYHNIKQTRNEAKVKHLISKRDERYKSKTLAFHCIFFLYGLKALANNACV